MAIKAVVTRSFQLDVELDKRLETHLQTKRASFSSFVRDLIVAEIEKSKPASH